MIGVLKTAIFTSADIVHVMFFSLENILLERAAHTPPSRWVLVEEEVENRWPEAERARHCSSAPPSAISPTKEDVREEQGGDIVLAHYVQHLLRRIVQDRIFQLLPQ